MIIGAIKRQKAEKDKKGEGEGLAECRICKKEFKKITTSHLRTHSYTMDQYIKEYEPEKAKEIALIQFINDFYISVRYRFLEYTNGQAYTVKKGDTRSWGLCDNDIKEHLQGKKTIGIYFPKDYSDLIGLDVDSLDIDLLNRTYQTIINYGIDNNNILISHSGGKGYHIDIFLSQMIDKVIINKFYEVLLNDLAVSKKQIELRGGGDQAYKLPLGFHHRTGGYCYPCNEWGRELGIGVLSDIKKLDIQTITEIVEINYRADIDIDLIVQFEELNESIQLLPIYQNTNDNKIKQIERLIDEGVHEVGSRQISIREVSAYLKDVKGYCIAETMEFMKQWINTKWSKTIVDNEVRNHIQHTVKSVYKTGYRFRIQANKITITLPEIREVFSIDTGHKLQNEALRRLYYIFMIHSKAYADQEGIFYMTYKQLIDMGGKNHISRLKEQINALERLGKLLVVERGTAAPEGGFKKKPNKYKLTHFTSYEKGIKAFTVCNGAELCKDCLYKALCYLSNDRERRKHIKGKKYKSLKSCPYNLS